MSNRKLIVNSNQIQLGKRTLEVVEYAFANPELNYKQLAAHFQISEQRIGQIMKNDRVLAAFPILARKRVKSMVPKAMRRLGQLMEQKDNLEVSRKVVEVVLNTEKVLEPTPLLNLNVFQSASIDDLKRMINENHSIDIPLSDVSITPELDNPLDNGSTH